MKLIKIVIGLLLLSSCGSYKQKITDNPDVIIFMDYYNIDFNIKPIHKKLVPKNHIKNMFLYDKFDGFIESDEDAKIYLIFVNDNEIFLLKKSVYYKFSLKGSFLEQEKHLKRIKILYQKKILENKLN